LAAVSPGWQADELMRILHVSDLHYSVPQFDWMVAAASDFDLLILAGDHLRVGSVVPLDTQSETILEYFSLLQSASQLAACSGNHDLTGRDAEGEQSALWLKGALDDGILTDGSSEFVGTTLVTICPWWDGPKGRAELVARFVADAARRPVRWIWVYHWPPLGSLTSWTGRRDYGDRDLRAWIEEYRPDIVLTGHIHQAPFTPDGSWVDRIGDTWVFNAGHQIGPIPAHIDLDLTENTAKWVSLLGTEELDLSLALAPQKTLI
jgi:Icc-related predicted phosphoesterase